MTAVEGCSGLGRAKHVEPVAAAHLQIAQDDIELPFMQLLDGDVAVWRLVHFVVRVRKRPDDPAPQRIVIVCNQNPTHVCSLNPFSRTIPAGSSPAA